MKVLIETKKKTYRWRMPQWLKYIALSALGLATFLGMFAVYADAIGHPLWG